MSAQRVSEHPVGTVLLHPEPTETAPGRPQGSGDPRATRIWKVATSHPGEWPWRRFTGLPAEVPARGEDLAGWRVQPLWQVAQVMGHPE